MKFSSIIKRKKVEEIPDSVSDESLLSITNAIQEEYIKTRVCLEIKLKNGETISYRLSEIDNIYFEID